ncbi:MULTISPECIES: hypothetical protein [Streptomyces]|uniref:Uncharacterized protein n=2 Tax=Streptomyces rimosus subsp. rimosus TaxID=132474 RepID=L8EHG1_STRR1|nr:MULTISPECIES: hypothetical protein [Streptomyces]KOG79557.1 hypothetical protein ADK78_06125 [Kitasatospora aureofaciens]MYT46152.1 hypothetical protein [Streptomyces sp. SID5471]KEF06646.1 hypothetical protein DF17_12815 [Streptomyces rimosus]KEF15286.1 hypothetical protein DF18_34655 [Streptomyces rimosus]KOT43778.1 hypothetical protein ADK42_07210 [Streptomyces rimosus subsp. rimosus]
MKALSEQLSELAERARKVEDVVAAAREDNRARLETKQRELQQSVAEGKARADQRITAARETERKRWNALHASVDQWFTELRADADKHRAERDVRKAQRRADMLEEDAVNTINLALYVLDQAEYAVIDAVVARADADDLTQHS